MSDDADKETTSGHQTFVQLMTGSETENATPLRYPWLRIRPEIRCPDTLTCLAV